MNPKNYLWQQFFPGSGGIDVHRFVRNGGRALHVHDYFEFILVSQGTGQFLLSNRKVLLKAGSLLIVPPGVLHSYADCRNLHMLFCSVRSDTIGKIALWTGCSLDWFGGARAQDPKASSIGTYRLPPAALRRIQSLNGIAGLARGGKASTQVARLAFFFGFLSEIIKIEEASATGKEKILQMHPLTVSALELLHEERREPWTLASLSRQLHHVHPVYLGRLFKRDLKMSPMRFLRRMRCQRAAKELSSSDLSIAEIAYQAGWIDPNLFSRVFNQEMGMSPTKYRASSRLKG